MRVSPRSLSLLVVVALTACGGAEPAATAPPVGGPPPAAGTAATPAAGAPAAGAPAAGAPAAGAPAAAASPAPTVAFKDMTNDQKLQHMKTVIAPTMGKIFTAYDPKDFAKFGCATCHGEKKEDPHKALPKLTLSGDGFKKLSAEKPAIMKFMSEQVVPAMAKAMNEKPFDPATHQGFGCGGCHTVQ
jgi:hypothetical protein